MEKEVVTEIASQLGIAVESAGQFLEDILPAYGAMKTAQMLFVDVSFAVMSIISAVVFIMSYKNAKRRYQRTNDDGYWLNDFAFDHFVTTIICACVWALSALVILFVTCDGIGWAIAPEAKFLETVLQGMSKEAM